MLPTSSPSGQDLLMLLCQKQLQTSLAQQNPFSQLLQFNLQANLLKLMGQENSLAPNVDPAQAQLLPIPAFMGQMMNPAKLFPKAPSPDLSNFVLLNPAAQKAHQAANGDAKRPQLAVKQESSSLLSSIVNNAMSQMPVFTDQEQSRHLENSNLDDLDVLEGLSNKSKKIKKMNMCGHPERGHYAKNMCNPCYHKYGRTKKPWRCSHEKLYAHGLCQNCYINAYNKKRNDKMKEKKENASTFSGNEGDTDLPTSIDSNEPLTLEDKAAFGELEMVNQKISSNEISQI